MTEVFQAKFANASVFKQLIDSMKDLVVVGTFDCKKTGIEMQSLDSSHVSLCTLKLKAEGFETYRCDRDMTLGLSMPNLSKVLKCASNDDNVVMMSKHGDDFITLVFESLKMDKVTDFEFKLMEINTEQLGIPESESDCTITMSSNEFRTIISDLSPIGDTCTLTVDENGISFSSAGDIGSANIIVKKRVEGEEGGCTIRTNCPVKLPFASRYLANFTKATALSKNVILSLSNEQPLIVEYQIPDFGDVKYYLAPKMDES